MVGKKEIDFNFWSAFKKIFLTQREEKNIEYLFFLIFLEGESGKAKGFLNVQLIK